MNTSGIGGYFRQGLFGRDLLASVVVFLVALPLCMGIAIASGMPPAAGLITGIVGGLVVGFLAGSPLQVSGPAAGLAVLVFELVREHGAVALGPVILVAGAIQLIAGLCRAGVWFRMTSPAVVAGMLSGIGILIVASQAHVLMDAAPKAAVWKTSLHCLACCGRPSARGPAVMRCSWVWRRSVSSWPGTNCALSACGFCRVH